MTAAMARNGTLTRTEHFDVLIAGAGISGIGGAYHLTKQCPDKTFVVLDASRCLDWSGCRLGDTYQRMG